MQLVLGIYTLPGRWPRRIISLLLLRTSRRAHRRAISALNRCAPIGARYWHAAVARIGAPIDATVYVYIHVTVNVNVNVKLG